MNRLRATSRGMSAGIAALVVADVALVLLAMNYTKGVPSTAVPVSISTTGTTSPTSAPATSAPTSASPAAPSAAPANAAAVQPAPLTGTLVAASGTVAWRTVTGSCAAGGGSVSVSTDGGKSWARRQLPDPVVMRVKPSGPAVSFVVSGGKDCKAGVRTTADGGATWSQPGNVASTWFRDPLDDQIVHSPGPKTSKPCESRAVIDLAPVTASSAAALCLDGAVQSSADSGATWTAAGTAPGAVALDAREENGGKAAYVVRSGAAACAGLQIARLRGSEPEALGCVAVSGAPVDAGTIALSVHGADGWLQVGQRFWLSHDAFKTWSSA